MYYDTIGVDCTAEPNDIRKAYLSSFKVANPKTRQLLNMAKSILNDETSRRHYDAAALKYKTLDG